ncbi:MAG TPA: glycosyltransferase [Ktedonobacterales bacterium]|nr:glycosyltransferase [Ktedonobacterales bacterium]
MCFRVAMLSLHTSPLAPLGKSVEAGGMNVYVRELARELGKRGLIVDIFTRWTDPTTPRILPLGEHVRVIHIKAGPIARLHKNDLFQHVPEFVRRVQQFAECEEHSYNVIHSHYWLSGVAGMQLAKAWDIPHLTMFHTLARLKQQARPEERETALRIEYEGRIINSVDQIAVSTPHERDQIARIYGISRARMTIVPCGVDLRHFHPQNREQARASLGLNGKPTLLFVGRPDPLKGGDLLIQAAGLLQQPAEVVMIGGNLEDDPELERLREAARVQGLADVVRFVGAVPQEELPRYYSAADLMVVPSYYESFGLVAVEALACGTPVIATKVGGLQYIVQDGENGFLVPWRCAGFFAEKIDAVLGDETLLDDLRHNARASVTRYSWRAVAEQIRQVYDTLTSERRAVAACCCF